MSARDQERRYGLPIYPKRDLTIVRGEGATVWDEDGRAYVDCTSGVGVANVGHANPAVARAISEQAARLITCGGIFDNDVRALLMEKLVAIAPPGLERAFLCNSGAEAVEAALKFARHTTGRHRVLAAMRGFHGRTLGALSATHRYRKDFEPLLPGVSFVPYGKLEKVEEALTDEIGAVLLEPVQGEGGVRPGEPEYLRAVQALCRERGALFAVDEIQTGFCRTGRMFASEHAGLEPDLLCLAKAIAGGVPMGAVLCSDRVEAKVGVHGSTFGGNPLACAAALGAIDYMEEHGLAARAEALGNEFAQRFTAHLPDRVRELRQIGLMIGIELKEKATPFLRQMMEEGVLALPAGPTVIRLLPPLTITRQELRQVIDALAVLES